MLSKRERLTKKEFDHFFQKGRRLHHALFTLVYTKHPTFHASVVVSKKIAQRSVQRNNIRRQIYNTLKNLARTNTLNGVFIVIVKKDVATVSRDVITTTLKELIGRINIKG